MHILYTTETFDAWFHGIRDPLGKRRIQARIDLAESGHFGDHKTVGLHVFEMLIHHGSGYRIYATQINQVIYVLLGGDDRETLRSDVLKAQHLAKALRDPKTEIGGLLQ